MRRSVSGPLRLLGCALLQVLVHTCIQQKYKRGGRHGQRGSVEGGEGRASDPMLIHMWVLGESRDDSYGNPSPRASINYYV